MTQSKVPGPNLGTVTIGGTVVEKQDQTANVAMTWTSATGLNTTTATYTATGYGTANVAVRVPTTTTAGAVTIEVSQDGTDWVPAGAVRQDNSYPENPVPLAYFPGTNGTRIYALSIDAFTLIRVKLTTVIVGAGNVVVTISAVAGGIEPVVAQRSRKAATYRAIFRTTTAPYTFSQALVASTRKQFATIHHAAASARTVKIRSCWLMLTGYNAAAITSVDFVRITTAPVTGNPAITPAPADNADPAAEATCLTLPTTQATEVAVDRAYSSRQLNGAAAAGSANLNDMAMVAIDVLNLSGYELDDESKPPTIRAGVLEGYAVTLTSGGAPTISGIIIMEFTEESP